MKEHSLIILIASLQELAPFCQAPDKINQYIEALRKIAKSPTTIANHGKGEDDAIASFVIIAVTLFPDIITNPKNQKFKALCLGLKPERITLPAEILNAFHQSNVTKTFKLK